jgi:hypothetical protein
LVSVTLPVICTHRHALSHCTRSSASLTEALQAPVDGNVAVIDDVIVDLFTVVVVAGVNVVVVVAVAVVAVVPVVDGNNSI